MHKNLLKLLLIISFFITLPVNAACSYKEQAELNKEVANIKVEYEIFKVSSTSKNPDTEEDMDMSYDIFRINILNVFDDFYIKYSNNVNNDNKTLYYSNSSKDIITFEWRDLSKVTTMTFKVYTSSKTGCKDELIRTMYLTLPRYNDYSKWGICEGKQVGVCDEYVTFDEITYDEFIKRVTSTSNDNDNNNININTNTNQTIIETKTNNTYLYIGIGTMALIIIIVIVFTVRKRNSI